MPWQPFLCGGLAAITAEAFTYPFDTSKTRLQIQGQTADSRLSAMRYRGMSDTLVTVVREEGVSALFSGVRYAFLRQATYGTLRLGVYYSLKEEWEKRHDGGYMPLTHLVALGSGVGAVGAFLTTPTEVLRVRAQAASTPKPHTQLPSSCSSQQRTPQPPSSSSIARGFLHVYHTEGRRGLYRGAVPNAQRAAVVNGVEIPTYDICKRWLVSGGRAWGGVVSSGGAWLEDSIITHLVCSLCAGLAGTCFSQPIDVARTRMMNQTVVEGEEVVRLYRGVVDTLWHTVRNEGVLALWKGFIPTFCRLGPWNVVFFMSLEQLKHLDNHNNQN